MGDAGRLQRIQNMAAGANTGSKEMDHITQVLYSLHWSPVEQRNKFKILVFVFKYLHNVTVFSRTPCTAITKRAISVARPILWNPLPLEMSTVSSLHTNKR